MDLFLTSTRLFLVVGELLVKSYYEGRRVSSVELATKYNSHSRSIVPMLNKLTRAGYLRSYVGGANPGHIFSKDPKTISVAEIIVALQGSLYMKSCSAILPGITSSCTAENPCNFCEIIVSKCIPGMRQLLRKVTMHDLYRGIPETLGFENHPL